MIQWFNFKQFSLAYVYKVDGSKYCYVSLTNQLNTSHC